jgi:uncharacterized RDD family membrane protein YckC
MARVIDFFIVIGVYFLFYLVERMLGFQLDYTGMFEYSPPFSLETFLAYNLPGLVLTFFALKLFVALPYFVLMESSPLQATVGKLILDLKVTDLSGERISFRRATGRYFLKSFSAFLFMLGYLLTFSDRKQAWHDYIAKTMVLRRAVFPAYYTLPLVPARWMFELPFSKPDEVVTTSPAPGYMCLFCRHRASEKHLGCPNCGRRYGFGEVRAIGAVEFMNGIVFTLIGGFVLYLAGNTLHFVVAGETPWYIAALELGIGGVLTIGGVSGFFGRNWLLKWILAFVT